MSFQSTVAAPVCTEHDDKRTIDDPAYTPVLREAVYVVLTERGHVYSVVAAIKPAS